MNEHEVEGTVPSQWWLDLKVENQRLREALREIAEFDVGVRLAPVAACKEVAANALHGETDA